MDGCSDCPLPPNEDNICRRTSEEDVLIVAQRHAGHSCEYTLTVKSIVVWEGVAKQRADEAYHVTKTHLPESEAFLLRRCAQNAARDCQCQGRVEEVEGEADNKGVSYSFGCSWNTYTKGKASEILLMLVESQM